MIRTPKKMLPYTDPQCDYTKEELQEAFVYEMKNQEESYLLKTLIHTRSYPSKSYTPLELMIQALTDPEEGKFTAHFMIMKYRERKAKIEQ